MQVDKVKVDMLGGFSVSVNGKPLVKQANKLTKPWQLFCYLVLHRDKFVSNRRLISVLWSNDDLADPSNVLKNAVYSLRKELCGGESVTDSPIIYSSGGYRFDPAVEVDLDADRFLALHQQAKEETEPDRRIELCQNAIELYKGEFLPQLDQELWVVPMALEYKSAYLDCAYMLCEIYAQRELWQEVLDLTTAANEIEPLGERNVVFMFRALEALRMYRVIVTTYSRTSQAFEDASAGQPPAEATRIFNAASSRINKTEQDIIIIKTELADTEQSSRPSRGAYFTTYNGLRVMYPYLKRSTERSGQALVLALFTVTNNKNVNPGQNDLTRAMAELKVVAMNTLRKADTIARYSKNQFVMLLSVHSLDDGRLVRDRIKANYAQAATSKRVTIDVKLTEV